MSIPRSLALSRILRASVLALVLGALGCASVPSQLTAWVPEPTPSPFTAEIQVEPLGPGAVFASPQDAAMDALAWCYLTARERPLELRLARGGTIHAVAGGFSYDAPSVEQRSSGLLSYRMGPGDVAHYRHYPVRRTAIRGFRSIDHEAHRLVDQVDPVSRPFFFLTPERGIHVYDADEDGVRSLAHVHFGARRGATSLAMSVPESAGPEQPLALDDSRR